MSEQIQPTTVLHESYQSLKSQLAGYAASFIQSGGKELSEEDRQQMESRILQKLEAGKKLTAEEIDFLRKYNPTLYQRYLRIQRMAEAMKERLNHARSKEEANEIIGQSLSTVSDKDPDKKYIIAAMQEAAKEFKQSSAYGRLPNTREDAEKKKGRNDSSHSHREEEEESFDPYAWSPLQEVLDMQPTFRSKA